MSFDILRDGDGEGREQFPLSMLLCAGTQADTALSNRYKQTNTVFKAAVRPKHVEDVGVIVASPRWCQ